MKLPSSVSAVVFLCLAGSSFGQSIYLDRETSEKGIYPTGSYSLSDIETVNNSNGNLALSIPVGPLPSNRSGMGPLRLVYNSALRDVAYTWNTSTTPYQVQRQIIRSADGGWQYGYDYGIRLFTRPESSNGGGFPCGGAEDYPNKFFLTTPDGGLRALALKDTYPARADGYSRFDLDGRSSSCTGAVSYNGQASGTLVLYSTDSSYLRVEIPYDLTTSTHWPSRTWKLYFPDGSVAEGKGGGTTKFTDPNGWSWNYNRFYDPQSNLVSLYIVEAQAPNRGVTATFGSTLSNPTGSDDITWWGYSSNSLGITALRTTVNWAPVFVSTYGHDCGDPSGNTTCTFNGGGYNVTTIVVAKAKSTDPDFSYYFEYRDIAHCASGLRCYGEIGKIKMPSGQASDRLEATYEYSKETTWTINSTDLDNPVKKKVLTYLERSETGATTTRTETTTYNFTETHSIVSLLEAGTVAEYDFFPRNAGAPAMHGLVYKTKNPDGSIAEKLWWSNTPAGLNPLNPESNLYVRMEVVTLPGSPSKSAAKRFTIDRNGNPTVTEEYGWVDNATIQRNIQGQLNSDTPPATSLTPPTTSLLLRKTTNTYWLPIANAANGMPSISDDANGYWQGSFNRNIRTLKRSETFDPSQGLIVAAREVTYDNAYLNGNKLFEYQWNSELAPSAPASLNASNSAQTQYSYSSACAGFLETVTDANGYQNKTTWPADCTYPTSQVSAFGRPEARTTNYEFHLYTGVLKQMVDADNLITTIFDYDALGRRILEREAANTIYERKTVTEFNDVDRTVYVRRDNETTGDGRDATTNYFDSRGFNWLTIQAENGGLQPATCSANCIKTHRRSLAISNATYSLETNPFRPSSDADTKGWTRTTKDATGRTTSIASFSGDVPASWWTTSTSGSTALGDTRLTYDTDKTTVTDPANKVSWSRRDALGRTSAANTGGLSDATYSYDALNNLRQVTQGAQTRLFFYTSRSQLKQSIQPENGTTQYSYDAKGNLLTRIDANGRRIDFLPPVSAPSEKAYDGLNRPRRKKIELSASTSDYVTWSWDPGSSYSDGQLGSITYGDTTINYSNYDPHGRAHNHSQVTAGQTYPFSYEFYLNEQLKSITYPSGRHVTYGLDYMGRSVSASAANRQYVTSATYAPHGAPRQVNFAAGALRADWLQFNGKLQVTQYAVSKQTAPTGTLFGLLSDYGTTSNNGNPQWHSVNDGIRTRIQNFTYDAANRVKTASEAYAGVPNERGYTQTFDYDAYNNRWISSGDLASPNYQPVSASSFNTANNRFNTATFGGQFDNAGQMTQHSNVTLPSLYATDTWDGEGRRTASTLNSSGTSWQTTFSYDGYGRRVKKNNTTTGLTVFVYDQFGTMAAEYTTASGATPDCDTCYVFSDPHGSTRLVADPAAAAIRRFDTMPFGEPIYFGQPWANGRTGSAYDTASTMKWRFAGGYKDDGAAEWPLDYMSARSYSGGYGRFVSPDENLVDQAPGDPMSWNLFSYARNNPLRNSDPSGEACVYIGPTETAYYSPNNPDLYRDDGGPGQPCDKAKKPQVYTFNEDPDTPGLVEMDGVFWWVMGRGMLAPAGERGLIENNEFFGLVGLGRGAVGGAFRSLARPPADPAALLQGLVTQVNREFMRDQSAMLRKLSAGERRASLANKGIFKANYGKAVEREVAERIKRDPNLKSMFEWTGNAGSRGGPDFVGRGRASGRTFDVTTAKGAAEHATRPYSNLSVVSYQGPW